MAVENILDLTGTSVPSFSLGPIGTGVRLKNNAGNLVIRNNADTLDAQITTSQLNVSGNSIVLNSDAAGSGDDWSITITRPTTGMTANLTFTLPTNDGSPGQVLSTDGSGVLSWVSAASTTDAKKTFSKTVNFGDGSTISMFTLPANAIVHEVDVIVDTPFNGTNPTLSVGVTAGSASKFMQTSENSLKADAGSNFAATSCNAVPPEGTTQALEVAYAADSSSAGVARVVVTYSVPNT